MRRSLCLTSVMLGLLAAAPRAAQAQLPTPNDMLGYVMGYSIGVYFNNAVKLARPRAAAFRLGLDDAIAGRLQVDLGEWQAKMGPLLERDARSPAPAPAAKTILTADVDKVAYTIGARLAPKVASLQLGARSLDWLRRGLDDSLAGTKARFALASASAKLEAAWQREPEAEQDGDVGPEAAASASRKRPQRVRGGLMSSVRAGKGRKPERRGLVKVRIEGKLADGTVVVPAKTTTTVIAQLIPCLREALPRMAVGESAELTCPAAFGARGVPGRIPPAATVLFTVELLDLASPIAPEVLP